MLGVAVLVTSGVVLSGPELGAVVVTGGVVLSGPELGAVAGAVVAGVPWVSSVLDAVVTSWGAPAEVWGPEVDARAGDVVEIVTGVLTMPTT